LGLPAPDSSMPWGKFQCALWVKICSWRPWEKLQRLKKQGGFGFVIFVYLINHFLSNKFGD
jgi:hypothetical protein